MSIERVGIQAAQRGIEVSGRPADGTQYIGAAQTTGAVPETLVTLPVSERRAVPVLHAPMSEVGVGVATHRPAERLLPDEPHDEPRNDALAKLATYRRVSGFARRILEEQEQNAGDVEQPTKEGRKGGWVTTTRETGSIRQAESFELTIDDNLQNPEDKLRLTRRSVRTARHSDTLHHQTTAWVMDGSGTVIRYSPEREVPSETGPVEVFSPPDTQGPRHAIDEGDVSTDELPVQGATAPSKNVEQEFEERVARGNPEEGEVGPAVTQELLDILSAKVSNL